MTRTFTQVRNPAGWPEPIRSRVTNALVAGTNQKPQYKRPSGRNQLYFFLQKEEKRPEPIIFRVIQNEEKHMTLLKKMDYQTYFSGEELKKVSGIYKNLIQASV